MEASEASVAVPGLNGLQEPYDFLGASAGDQFGRCLVPQFPYSGFE